MAYNDDMLADIRVDLDHLTEWTHTHDEEHVNESNRMNLILQLLARREEAQGEHDNNHHGTVTKVKRDGLVVLAVSIIYALVELLRSGFFPV